MDGLVFALLALIVAIVAAAALIVMFFKRRDLPESQTVDFRAYFVVGVVLLLMGVGMAVLLVTTMDGWWIPTIPLFVLGAVYVFLGWSNREKWLQR